MGPMSAQPPSVSQTATAAPLSPPTQSAAAGGNPVGAGSFVDRLAMLLQALTPQSPEAGATTASADQPVATTPASAEAEATNSLVAAMSGASAARSQIGPLATAATPQASDAGSARARDGGSNKPKTEPATPTRRASATSSPRTMIPDPIVLPTPDSPVALPAPPPAVSDL